MLAHAVTYTRKPPLPIGNGCPLLRLISPDAMPMQTMLRVWYCDQSQSVEHVCTGYSTNGCTYNLHAHTHAQTLPHSPTRNPTQNKTVPAVPRGHSGGVAHSTHPIPMQDVRQVRAGLVSCRCAMIEGMWDRMCMISQSIAPVNVDYDDHHHYHNHHNSHTPSPPSQPSPSPPRPPSQPSPSPPRPLSQPLSVAILILFPL